MRKYFFALLMLAAVPIIASAHQTLPPTPAVTAAASPSPSPSSTLAPIVRPVVAPSSFPTPLVLGPDASPQILAIAVNAPIFHSGDTFASTVITSTNVAAVEMRLAGQAIRFLRVDFGVWQLSYKLPPIPRRMLHNYSGQIVAMNSAGITTTEPVTISLR